MEVDKSSLIVSKAGRDKGQLFYVIDTDEQYVYLADGKSRKLEKPKRKKRKHVRSGPPDGVANRRENSQRRESTQ